MVGSEPTTAATIVSHQPQSKLQNNNDSNNVLQRQQQSTSSQSVLISGIWSANLHLDKVKKMEGHYYAIAERLATLSEVEMCDYMMSNVNNDTVTNEILDGIFFGFLIEQQNASKYLGYVSTYTNGWNHILYNVNFMLIEVFSFLKPQYRQQMVQFFAETFKLTIPGLDACLSFLFRALSDGIEFRETSKLVYSTAQLLNANRPWIVGLKKNSMVLADAFAFMSRFVVDTQLVTNNSIPVELFKTTLVSTCELLIRERFADLAANMGKDLLIALMRLAKLPQFLCVWKSLLHNPTSLMANLSLQQQLMFSPSTQYLGSRVSVHISRKVEQLIRAIKPMIIGAKSTDLLARHYESLKNSHLGGPDSGTIRAEIIRHIWALLKPEEFNHTSIEARASLLAWLLRTARMGAEQQWCKLVLFWEWFGFDVRNPNGYLYIEPAFSATKNLLNTHPQIGNSLIDFLIRESQSLYPQLSTYFVNSITNAFKSLEKANIPIQTVLAHSRLEQPLKDQLRLTFPDLFPKKIVAIADNLAEPSTIIDFDAIRNTSAISAPMMNAEEADQSMATTITNGKEPSAEKRMKPKLEQISSKSGGDLKRMEESTMNTQSPTQKKKIRTTEDGNGHHHARKRKRRKSKEEPIELNEAKLEKPNESKTSYQTVPTYYTQSMPSTSTASEERLTLSLTIAENDADGPEIEANEGDEEERDDDTRKLEYLLPMVREEFREHLESLEDAMRESEYSQDAVEEVQALADSIFDADELDNEQAECIALCLSRIFLGYLRRKAYLTEGSAQKESDDHFGHPIYRLFRVLVRAADNTDSRKYFLMILAKMRNECSRIGYLFLFYMRKVECNMRSNQGDDGVDVERVVDAYKEICKEMETSWETMLIKDLEKCSFDDTQLFAHILPCVLASITPYGSPPKLMRLICSTIDPRQLSQLMSEVVRENVVLFPAENVLALLHDSLRWESIEQFMLWQLIQVEAVEFDKFLDLLQRLSYAQHPEATAAILVIIRNMEPGADAAVMRSLLKNLLLRPPNRDLFTVDALKLLVDYEDNIPPMSDCVSKLLKTALHNGDLISAPSGELKPSKGRPRVLTVEAIIDHLDRFRQHCLDKESKGAENLFNNALILEMFDSLNASTKLNEIRSRFEGLFAFMSILLEDKRDRKETGRHRRKGKGNVHSSREGTPTKKKKRVAQESDSEED